ncbi:MAG: hypothetical protein FWF83_05060, partial [Clostridiales bacterium]|nr:hypothetical protein [Clostridiales bacterium]
MPARSSTTAPAKGIAGVEAAIKEIEVGLIRPVYLLYGAEAYLRDRFLAALRLIWLGGSGDGYALVREDSKTTQTQLVDAASQISLLPGHRLILVDDPAFVPCGKAQGAEGGVSDSDASSDEASDSDASDSESQGDTEQPGLAQAKAFPDDTRPGSARRPLPSEPDPLLSYIAAPSPEVCIVLL